VQAGVSLYCAAVMNRSAGVVLKRLWKSSPLVWFPWVGRRGEAVLSALWNRSALVGARGPRLHAGRFAGVGAGGRFQRSLVLENQGRLAAKGDFFATLLA